MFSGTLIRDVDRRIAKGWAFRFLRGAPFSRLRLSWKEEHCAVLNPYRSADCPYPERDCVMAFWLGVERTISEADNAQHAVGYFRTQAKRMALDRAENKPLSRERQGNAAPAGAGPAAGLPGVPGADSRFERLGDILSRAIDSRPHPGQLREDG
jgi:hypothetical protein